MTEDDRRALISDLDRELLIGGVTLSEWSAFITREADIAFINGADLASILTSVSAVETYLRSEYGPGQKQPLIHLIDAAPIDPNLKQDLHKLRKYRNKWVHVGDPGDDSEILENPEKYVQELEEMALFAARTLRRTIYENQWI